MRTRFSLSLVNAMLAVSVALSASCSDGSTGPKGARPVASIRITGAPTQLTLGDSVTIIAMPLDANGNALADRPVTFTSTSATRVTANASGMLRAIGLGAAQVMVSAEQVTQTVALTVVPPPLESIVFSDSNIMLDEGSTQQVSAVVKNVLGVEFPARGIVWSSLDPDIAIREPGLIRALRAGTARFRVNSDTLEAFLTVTVRAPFAAQLLYSDFLSGESRPRVFRTDLRDTPESDVSIFTSPGSWHPMPSPDGQRLAFGCVSNFGPTICVSNADGSDVVALLKDDAFHEDQPSWSPDGQRIAFRRQPHGATVPYNPTDIWTMNADGTDLVNVTRDSQSQHWPMWSPAQVGGSYRMAFVQDSIVDGYMTSRIYTMRPDGTDRRAETPVGAKTEGRAMWSPNATSLVFSRLGEGAMDEIFVVSVGTMTERLLLAERIIGGQAWPAWSPDGRHVAFTSSHEPVNVSVAPQVYTVRADGTQLRRRTSGGHDKQQLVWLPTP